MVGRSIVLGTRLSWLNARRETESYTLLAIKTESLDNSDEEQNKSPLEESMRKREPEIFVPRRWVR